jgi:hypothetical protein
VQRLERVSAGGQWLEKESASRAMTKLVRPRSQGRFATSVEPDRAAYFPASRST